VDAFTGDAVYCAANARCDPGVDAPVCRELPGGEEPCHILENGWGICNDSSRCENDSDPPMCDALPGPGDPCSDDDPCTGKLYCGCPEGYCADPFCIRFRFPGESCTEPYDVCLETVSACKKGVCVALEPPDRFEELCGPPEPES